MTDSEITFEISESEFMTLAKLAHVHNRSVNDEATIAIQRYLIRCLLEDIEESRKQQSQDDDCGGCPECKPENDWICCEKV